MAMRNRMIAGPMERALANRDGSLNHRYVDYLAERARGGAALSVIESTYVDTRGMGNLHQVGCHADHVIPGLRRAADAVHAEGGKLGTELYFGGRVTSSINSQRQPLAASSVPSELLSPMPIPRELTVGELTEIRFRFAAAAERAVAAGLDMVHLHGAHGYLLGAFVSPFSNTRTDAYGGSLENRARFPLEVLAAVRATVGDDYPIGWRLSAEEYVPGGLEVVEAAAFSVMLADAGIDLIDVAGGIYETVDMICQGALAPKGGFVANALVIKAAVGARVPVSVAQRLNDADLANGVLGKGLDYVTLSRAFHADPHFARKVREGRADEIIPCIACLRCSDLLAANEQVRCAINTATALERRRATLPARRARTVMVVGAGPAGLQAACLLAERGHRVSLHEQRDLGGQVRLSARVAPDYRLMVVHLTDRLGRLGVEVRLGAAVGPGEIRDRSPDAVVIATGAGPGPWFCSVAADATTFDLFSAFERPQGEWAGETVVIVGGDTASCFLALHVARAGGRVHLIEPRAQAAYDGGVASAGSLRLTLSRTQVIAMHLESTVEYVERDAVILQRRGELSRLECDSVIVGGRIANNELFETVLEAADSIEAHVIGDALRPRDIYAASHDAADACELIHLGAPPI
jgi:2,4-dienoyl-CoA reductase-like NADH-dependent reductase (Old Yellow Enzyme family)/thioredoxin reductase